MNTPHRKRFAGRGIPLLAFCTVVSTVIMGSVADPVHAATLPSAVNGQK